MLLSPRKPQGEARKDPPTEILTGLDTPATELVTSTEGSAPSYMGQSPSSSSTISGESINLCKSSQTALTCDRHNSSMADLNSLMNKFRENQDDAAFILSSINGVLGSMRVADHCESLKDVMTCLRSMAITVGTIKRTHSDQITSNDMASMTSILDDLVGRRQVCYESLDKKSEARQTILSEDPETISENKLQEDKAGHCEERPMTEVYSTLSLSVTAQTQLDTVLLSLFLYSTSSYLDGLDTTRLVSHVPMAEQSALNSQADVVSTLPRDTWPGHYALTMSDHYH
jgi:hypothetical protein